MTVEIPISADLDLSALNQKLAQFTRLINQTGEQIARAGRVQFQPISRATLETARQYEATVKNIARLAPELHKRLQATGQDASKPDTWQWERLYGDPAQRFRAQRNFFTLATGIDFGPRIPTAGGPAPSYGSAMAPGAPGIRQQQRSMGATLADSLEQVVRAGGMPGQTAAASIHAGRTAAAAAAGGGAGRLGSIGAGLMGGAGAGLGFALISGIGSLISRISGAVTAAQDETIGGADLYRRTGGTGLGRSYDGVIAQTRRAARTLDLGFNETQQLAGLAARRGNLNDTLDLTRAVEQGGGFARAFGFDPSAGVSAFAGLRGVGVTRDNQESTRLGLAIATGIARAGVFAKAEDYLSEIASYGETTARASLQQTNLEGFNATLSSLVGMRIPGLDVRGAGNLLATADASLRQGGGAGEASQAFLYRVLGSENGRMGPIAAEVLQQGGLFATNRSIFGEGTVAGDYYRANGLATPDVNDPRTNLDRVLEGLRARYGNRPELQAHAMGRMFGINYAQSFALARLTPEQRRYVSRDLNLSNEQMAGMRPEAIAQLGRVAVASADNLDAMGAELAGRVGPRTLRPEDARALADARTAARGGSSEAVEQLRQVVARLTAQEGVEETEGDKTRRTVTGVANAIQELAATAVPIFNVMRDALLQLAGRAMGLRGAATPQQLASDRAIAEHDQANAQRRATLTAEQEAAEAAVADAQRRMDTETDPERSRQAVADMRAAQERLAAANAGITTLNTERAAAGNAARGPATPARVEGTVNDRAWQFAQAIEEAGGGAISRNAAVAFAGNAIRESGVRPGLEGDLNVPGGSSVGALQWRGQRRANFETMFGIPIGSATLQQQAQFAAWEVTGRVPPGVNPAVADRLPREGRAWRRIQEYVAQNGDTDENYAEAIARYYSRGALPDRDAAVARRNVAGMRAQGRPGAQATPAPGPAAQATPMPAGAPPGAAQATPLPEGAPPNAAAAAGPAAPAPVVVEGRVTGEMTVRNERGEIVAPAAPITGTITPPRPNGALLQPGAPLPTGRPAASLPFRRQ